VNLIQIIAVVVVVAVVVAFLLGVYSFVKTLAREELD